MIVSATLTQDPSKIDRLGLHCPRYIAVSSEDFRYKLPRELKEFKVGSAEPATINYPFAKPSFLLQLSIQQRFTEREGDAEKQSRP